MDCGIVEFRSADGQETLFHAQSLELFVVVRTLVMHFFVRRD